MRTYAGYLSVLAVLALFAACATHPADTPPPAAAPEPEPHHELHLPPVGPSVRVTSEGAGTDVVLETVPHEGSSAPLMALWKTAFPTEDPASMHFDLVGSDGFHPASRPKCTRPLSGAEVAAGHIDVVTHNVSFDDALNLPGCYRVKAVVRMDAAR